MQSAEFRILSPDRGTGKADVRRLIQDGIPVPNNGRCFPTTNISVGLPHSPFFFQPRFPIHLPSFTLSLMSSNNHAVHADRPERSRNAKAQARHRAKRKAYIEQVQDPFSQLSSTLNRPPQLEQTVTKLQMTAGFSQDQISVIPPPLLKIRQLEEENGRLQKENDELRRLLTADTPHTTKFSSDSVRRQQLPAYQDFRGIDRDYKRRKEGLYIVCLSYLIYVVGLLNRAHTSAPVTLLLMETIWHPGLRLH